MRSFPPSRPLRWRIVILLLGGAIIGFFGGCGTLHGSAQIGPDLKPRIGSSISLPLGK